MTSLQHTALMGQNNFTINLNNLPITPCISMHSLHTGLYTFP